MNCRENAPPSYLVTGGAGFIGSHLCEALLGTGCTVYAIDDLSTGSIENIRHLLPHPLFHFARASVMDQTVLDRLASEAEIVVHLAAAVGVQLIIEKPVHTIETNISGTEAVLRAAFRYGSRVLIASTSEVYGKGCKVPFQEDDDVLLGTTDKSRWAYAASKMVDEFLGLAYYREYGLEVVPFRLFNTVGVRQTGRYGMVVPRFVQAALRNKPLEVYGDGSQSRCFCDVRDVIKAIIGLSTHLKAPGTLFNIGTDEEISIMDLATRVKELTQSNSPIEVIPYERAYSCGFEDMMRRVPDTSRINELLGWKPRYSIDEILTAIIEEHESKMAKDGDH